MQVPCFFLISGRQFDCQPSH